MSNPGNRIYLDHNATTPLDPRVADEVEESLSVWGNPSSIHQEGRGARDLVETARRRVAASIGADPTEIVFTSGGTEANAIALRCLIGLTPGDGPPRLAVSAIAHPSLIPTPHLAAVSEVFVDSWPVDANGRLDPGSLTDTRTTAVAFCLANHEIGTIQDVEALSSQARGLGAHVHIDAVQAYGKIPLDVHALDADTVSVSAHKAYGPKGVGALWVRDGIDIEPLAGGHQERERRPGTENVPGIVGFGKAAELIAERLDKAPEIEALGRRLCEGLLAIDGAEIANPGGPRLSSTVNARFRGAAGEVVVQALDLAGVACSTGAACTSGSVEPSPVLLALGLPPERAAEAVRISLGVGSTASDIEALLELLPDIVNRARRFAETA